MINNSEIRRDSQIKLLRPKPKINIILVNKSIANCRDKIKLLDKKVIDEVSKDLDISFNELCHYQQQKSLALLSNLIDYETSIILFKALNNWRSVPLAERMVYTQIFYEICK